MANGYYAFLVLLTGVRLLKLTPKLIEEGIFCSTWRFFGIGLFPDFTVDNFMSLGLLTTESLIGGLSGVLVVGCLDLCVTFSFKLPTTFVRFRVMLCFCCCFVDEFGLILAVESNFAARFYLHLNSVVTVSNLRLAVLFCGDSAPLVNVLDLLISLSVFLVDV